MAAVAAYQHRGAAIGPVEVEESEAGGVHQAFSLLELLAAAVGAGRCASRPLVGAVSLQTAVEAFKESHVHPFPCLNLASVQLLHAGAASAKP